MQCWIYMIYIYHTIYIYMLMSKRKELKMKWWIDWRAHKTTAIENQWEKNSSVRVQWWILKILPFFFSIFTKSSLWYYLKASTCHHILLLIFINFYHIIISFVLFVFNYIASIMCYIELLKSDHFLHPLRSLKLFHPP